MTALAIALAGVASFILSGVYYAVVPSPVAADEQQPPKRSIAVQVVVELLRSGLVAALVAGLMTAATFSGVAAGVLLGLSLWVLPLVLLAGSVFHEGTAVRTAAVHAGDWLLKLVAIGVIVGLFI